MKEAVLFLAVDLAAVEDLPLPCPLEALSFARRGGEDGWKRRGC